MFANLGDSNHRRGRQDNRRGRQGWRPPPNYQSRAVKIRLFVLVSMVMLVLLFMSKVSDPKFWAFMGFQGDKSSTSTDEQVDEKVDTRVREGAKSPLARDAFSLPDAEPPSDEPAVIRQGAEFEFTQQDGWQYVHGELDEQQRELLYKVFKNVGDEIALAGDDVEAWNELLAKLTDGWNQFHAANKVAVADSTDTPEDHKQVWQQTLEKSESHWTEKVEPVLALAATGKSLNKEQLATLEQTQQQLDAVELKLVRDNTHLSRIREKNAWFRLFDQLNSLDEEQLIEQSSGRVSFLQLFRQPKQYRGKLVTIRGTARLAYHVQAPSNIFGIKGYYVFWVEPRGMSDQLINVYALETPEGFPEIKDKDLDKEKTKLFEPVEFTGFFFKNYSYRTKTGTNIAPLVLAKVPTWERPVQTTIKLPKVTYIVIGVLVIAVVAIGISVFAYIRSRDTSSLVTGYGVSARGKASQLRALENEEITDVGEQLRHLADSETTVAE